MICYRADVEFSTALALNEVDTLDPKLRQAIRSRWGTGKLLEMHIGGDGIKLSVDDSIAPYAEAADWKVSWADIVGEATTSHIVVVMYPQCRGPWTAAFCLLPRPDWL
jgi:hypothetical protein